MTKQVEIEVFNIARTKVDKEEVQRWLDYLGVHEFDWPNPQVVSEPALLVALAGKRCYLSFEQGLNPNISKIRKNYVDYFDNILSSGHGSILEHSVYSYAIEGCSRVFCAEMNRHRAGWAISEGSLRFIRFDKNIPYWVPTSLRDQESDNDDLRSLKKHSRRIFQEAFEHQEKKYAELVRLWDMEEGHHNFAYKKKITSQMRRIVGMGVATGGVWTGNIRALRHVISMRTDPAAEEEIFLVAGKIARDIVTKEPLLFGDFEETNGSFVPKNWKV
jgi:thymidylate synthase (FAD)